MRLNPILKVPIFMVLMCSGENILFLDLTSDPYLFKGPKGDKQVRKLVKTLSYFKSYEN